MIYFLIIKISQKIIYRRFRNKRSSFWFMQIQIKPTQQSNRVWLRESAYIRVIVPESIVM